MASRILIVEDERDIASFLRLELKHEGYEVDVAGNGREALEAYGNAELVLLDIMIPEISGMEVLRRIRKSSDVPVIMLTARGETFDKVSAFDLGADDYLVKPFEIEELLARIRRIFKKKSEAPKMQLCRVGEIELDPASCSVTAAGAPIELSGKEYKLLKYLMTNKNIALTREQILDAVWGYDYVGDQKAVDVYVSRVRAKIDERVGKPYISTVRGIGYIMKETP